jgi:hypothetical protein
MTIILRGLLVALTAFYLFLPSHALAGGFRYFISKEVQEAHPQLKFSLDERSEKAWGVRLPINGKPVDLRLYVTLPGITTFSGFGYQAIELKIGNQYVQVGNDVGFGTNFNKSFRIKSWPPDFEKSFKDLNHYLRNNYPDLTDKLRFKRSFWAYDRGAITRVNELNVYGTPLLYFASVSEVHTLKKVHALDRAGTSTFGLMKKVILPGWILVFDCGFYSPPTLIELIETDDMTLANPYLYIENLGDLVNIIPAELQEAWKKGCKEGNWLRNTDLSSTKKLTIYPEEGTISFTYFDDSSSYAHFALQITRNGRILQINHQPIQKDEPQFKFWLTKDSKPQLFSSIEELLEKHPSEFQMNHSFEENQGKPSLDLTFGGVPIRISYQANLYSPLIEQIVVGLGNTSNDPLTIHFGSKILKKGFSPSQRKEMSVIKGLSKGVKRIMILSR